MHPKADEQAAGKAKMAPFPSGGDTADFGIRLGRLEQRLMMAGVLDSDGK